MIIRLPYIDPIDTLNPPENLKEIVQFSFAKYTELTASEFTHEDKLSYLDNLRGFIHPGDPEEYVKNIIMDEVEYQLDEQGEYPDRSELYSFEFMCQCFAAGDKEFSPEKPFEKNHHDNTKTMKVIADIVQAIMNWSSDTGKIADSILSISRMCKFRGMDIHTKEWVTGFYVNSVKPGSSNESKFYIGHYIVTYPGYEQDWHEVYTDSIGLISPWHDLHGTELYDGDIVTVNEKLYMVYWNNAYFTVYMIDKDMKLISMVSFDSIKKCKVISTIYNERIKKDLKPKEDK